MVPRGLDHLVIAVRDLESLAAAWESLGFTLTPTACHPWGTANRLIQFPGHFLEVLTIAEPALIFERTGTRYSFGAFNRDFLAAGEGISMLVLEGRDADGDIVDFASAGLPVFERFDFEREARLPTGEVRKVAFSLAFTETADATRAGFFTCQQHHPENFWKREYQRHANGVTRVAALVAVASEPMRHASFLTAFTGGAEISENGSGLSIGTPRGRIDVLASDAFARRYGRLPAGDGLRFGALVFDCANPDHALDLARRGGLALDRHANGWVVRSRSLAGVAVQFRKESV